MYFIKEFMEIPSIRETIEQARIKGLKIALVFPIYSPAPLLRSFYIHPVELWNAPNMDLSLSDAHLQSYTCSLGRIILSFIKDQRFCRDYDIIFIPHICDTFQQIGSILMDFIKPPKPVVNFYLPKRNDESGISFCVDELRRIIEILERISGVDFDVERFKAELDKEMEINRLINEIYNNRESLPLSDFEFYRILSSRTYLFADTFIDLLKEVLSLKDERSEGLKKRIFLSGISAYPLELLNIINGFDARIVFDDLAICRRKVFDLSLSPTDPLKRQSEMMLFTLPDPQKGSPIEEKARWIISETKRTRASGGIFYIMKFCEPEYFYFPSLRNYLMKEGIRTFLLEYELSDQISRQNINRIQAFIEGL